MVVNTDTEKEYYLSTLDKRGDLLVYESDRFKFSEFDIINLIKICLIERRNQEIGKKILEVLRDSTEYKKEEVKEKLKKIGIEDGGRKPTREGGKIPNRF